jgi:hypothetical protein
MHESGVTALQSRGTIVVAGSVAAKPGHGGHAWVFLQYLLGFRRLGWDVLFLDALPANSATNVEYLESLTARFGLAENWSVSVGPKETAGLPRNDVLARVRRSSVLINIMGYLRDEEVLAAAPRLVFLDIDPGFGQMWKALGLADVFAGHDVFVTIGERIGSADCSVPVCGLSWITTPQPIVLAEWPVSSESVTGRFTSVASWRGAYGPVEFDGKVYGLRVHEFRLFADLPHRTGAPFELALDIHPNEVKDRTLLTDNGWSLANPRSVAGDTEAYREYVRGSWAEFQIAKGMYVQTRCGWLSDRSLCYLASGRPVLAQETGIGDCYPTGEGLLTFMTPDEAAAGVAAFRADYPRHARAARRLAEEFFDSDAVLTRLLTRLGID